MKKTIHSEHGKVICKELVEMRRKAGLTQRQVAKILNREHSFVAHCELGERRVDLAEFYWFCKACEARPERQASKLMRAFAQLEE